VLRRSHPVHPPGRPRPPSGLSPIE
jgi:hypothetical protein